MKIGVIGAGSWGKNLVRNFRDLGVLAGIADELESNRAWAAAECDGVSVFEDHAALLAAGFDAVAIATPAHTHFAIACDALAAGCDVFVEKPLTLDPGEAAELVRRSEQAGRITMVGHLLLYQPAISFIRDFLRAGKLGRVFSLHQQRSKLGRARAVENVLWSFGVHDVAVLLDLAGQLPATVTAFGHCGLQPGIEDDVHLHLRFPDGTAANLHNSWLWPKVERGLVVVGEKGMLEYDETGQQVIFHRKTINASLVNVEDGEEVVFAGNSQPLRLEMEHFITCCRDRLRPLSDARGGLAVVEVLARAEECLQKERRA